MVVKDKLAGWYIQNFVISKSQVFDSPGFISFKLSGKELRYSRQIIFSEKFFVDLENEICNELGEAGKQLLYSLGKKFGYRFAIVASLNQFDDLRSKAFEKYTYLLVRFVEGTYSSGISHSVDSSNEIINFELNNFVICSKSGKGFFLSAGGIAGIWAWLTDNKLVETVHYACQGRGDLRCQVVCGEAGKIKQVVKEDLFTETNLSNLNLDKEYFNINLPKQIQNSSKSFQFFLDAKVFNYSKGIVMHGAERFFIIESSIIYLLENVLAENQIAHNILSRTAFDFGNKLLENNKSASYLVDLLAALGFGDAFILKKKESFRINIDYFPWTGLANNTKHVFMQNFLSGALTTISGSKVALKLSFAGFNGKGYSIAFS
jgi:hypothetical protein